jgi:hypothetical protein
MRRVDVADSPNGEQQASKRRCDLAGRGACAAMGAERNGPSTVLRQTPGEAGAILHRFNCVHLLAAREGQPVEVVDDHTKCGAGLVLLLGDAVDVLQREVAWLARGDRRPGAAVSAACALSPSGLTPWLAQ